MAVAQATRPAEKTLDSQRDRTESSGRAGAFPATLIVSAGTFAFACMRNLFRLRYLRAARRRRRAAFRRLGAAKLVEHATAALAQGWRSTAACRRRLGCGWRAGIHD